MIVLYVTIVGDELVFAGKQMFSDVPNPGTFLEFWSTELNRVVAGNVLDSVAIEGTNCVSLKIEEAAPTGLVGPRSSLFESFAPATVMPEAKNAKGRTIEGDVL